MALMIVLPIFLSKPALLVGMPVSRANFCFIFVMPNALFNENDTPGIFIEIWLISGIVFYKFYRNTHYRNGDYYDTKVQKKFSFVQ